MSCSKANCGHRVIDLRVPRDRECTSPSSTLRSDRSESRKGNTHDELDVDGMLVFLTALVYTGELPLPLELYSSESDESVCVSSASEFELE
jgi:hypothetical protein